VNASWLTTSTRPVGRWKYAVISSDCISIPSTISLRRTRVI
jgi:hypothetical protein